MRITRVPEGLSGPGPESHPQAARRLGGRPRFVLAALVMAGVGGDDLQDRVFGGLGLDLAQIPPTLSALLLGGNHETPHSATLERISCEVKRGTGQPRSAGELSR